MSPRDFIFSLFRGILVFRVCVNTMTALVLKNVYVGRESESVIITYGDVLTILIAVRINKTGILSCFGTGFCELAHQSLSHTCVLTLMVIIYVFNHFQ